MALLGNETHYVRFFRGSISAWEALLLTPNKIDNDTLYFIYESIENVTEGKLYLGLKLISGVGGSGSININDIGDIYIDNETLADKQLLVYNETTLEWENASLSVIINSAISEFTGATADSAGTAGLVPAPAAGDQNKFLRGDKTWANVNLPSFDPLTFSSNSNNVITLAGFSSASVGTIPIKTGAGIEWAPLSVGNISRLIITKEELEEAIENGTASENIIYMIAIDNPEDSSNRYEEYMVVSNNMELVGTIGDVNLSDYVTTSAFNSRVGSLENSVSNINSRTTILETKIGDLNLLILSAGNSTLVEEMNTMNGEILELSERLLWNELANQEN